MNDPSQNVARELLAHIHLVSQYHFPRMNQPSSEFIADHLKPRILETEPVAWQAFNPPPPAGFTVLTWQSPQLQDHFPSDGYIWADQEQRFTQQLPQGYALDIFMHKTGYAPANPQPQYCSVSRRRYRLRPTPNGPPCDPNLWITMYLPAAPRDQVATNRVPLDQHQRAAFQRRMQLLQGGYLQLAQRAFKFGDPATYPVIGAAPPKHALTLRRGQLGYAASMILADTEKPAKRQRTGTRGGRPGTGGGDDEYTAELIDVLTPRDVSQQRFMQHHEWMEEVLASPYATAKIRPVALGFGRTGALEPLTRGLFTAPTTRPQRRKRLAKKNPDDPTEPDLAEYTFGVESATKLEPAVVAEFQERVTAKLDEINNEIAEEERVHAEHMAKLSTSARIREMEKRLRTAPLDSGTASGPATAETMDDIVRAMEASLGSRITPLPSVRRVQDGGLEDKAPSPAPAADSDVNMGGTGVDDAASAGIQPSGANSTGIGTPSFDNTGNATPTATAAVAASDPAPAPLATDTKQATEQPTAEGDDWVVVDKQDPKPGDASSTSTPLGENSGAPMAGPDEDIGADLIDFGDTSDVGMEGDDFTGGAFEEAIELTAPGDDLDAPETMDTPEGTSTASAAMQGMGTAATVSTAPASAGGLGERAEAGGQMAAPGPPNPDPAPAGP